VRYSPVTVPLGLSRIFVVGFALLAFVVPSFAQSQPSEPAPKPTLTAKTNSSTSPDYSKEGSVIEQTRASFKFENDGSGEETQYARVRIQSAQAVQAFGQLVFTYSSASDKISVDFVRVHKPDGKVVTAGADAVQDLSSPVERVAPMYSDIRQIHVTVPDLDAGDTLEYQIHSVTVHPVVPGQFFTQWNATKQIITLDETFEVNLPRNRDLHVKTSNGIAAPSIKNDGDRRIYTWHSSFTKRPDDSSSDQDKKSPKEPEQPDVQVSTFSNWQQLGEWYAELQKPRATVSPAVQTKADELVKGLSAPTDKARAIYDYVSENIRYVSLSFGLGRYQPHSADDVLSNQYGDCKDKATLFEAMLAAEHIDSYPVLINAERKLDPDMPSPGQFDHVINVVMLDGKPHWADTTAGVAPFGFLMPQLRDKQALAIPLTASASLQKTLLDPPVSPQTVLTIDGQVDSLGRLQGKLSISDNGEFAVIVRSALRVVPPNSWPVMAEKLVQSFLGNNAAKCTNPSFGNAEDIEQPLVFTAQFSEPNFLDLSRRDISVRIPSISVSTNDIAEPDKGSTEPLKLGFIQDDREIWKITVPSALSAALPLPVHVLRDYADYQSAYSSAAATVTVDRHMILRNSQISPSRYNDWEAFRTAVLGDAAQNLQFTNADPGSGSVPTGMSADDLYSAAVDAERSRNFRQAAQLYAAAAAKDPDHDGVWDALGYADIEMEDYADAIPPLQKAIAKNAYDANAYNSLGLAYRGLGRYDDAIAQFQKQIDVNPLDRYAHANLASVYLQQKKYDAAQKEYQTALKITPNNFGLNIGLGTADLGLHQDDAALAAFHIVLEKQPNPETWNNVAYYLADNNSHLDLAEQYSENSIHSIEAQLNAASLDTVGATQAGLVQTIATFWDTLGWIKFKQGNLKAAEDYIHAAWMLDDRADMGDHLGQIYEKEGRRDDAVRAYALALTYPDPPAETRGHLAALVGEKHVEKQIDAARSIERRAITLPNPQRIDGSAEYWILLSPAAAGAASPAEVKFIAVDDNPKNPSSPTGATKPTNDKTADQLRDALSTYAAALRTVKFPYSFPSGESGKIILRGTLACGNSGGASCTFTVLPANRTLRLSLASSSGLPQ
jgi:tetratricopeptide (TPR) repeat protein